MGLELTVQNRGEQNMKKQPNILLITTDQQRFDTCGPAAPSFMRTPHYNHLLNQGVAFNRAFADCPICVPSRITIMTGKSAATHGMKGNGETSEAMGSDETLPARLNGLGYQTCAVGKMHFGPERARHGFQEMILPADYYREMMKKGGPQPMRHGLGQNELYPGMATVPESETLTAWTSDQCAEYIKERRDPTKPFFLWCSYSKPHPPLDPPEPYYSMYRNSDIPEPYNPSWTDGDNCPPSFKNFRTRYGGDQLAGEVIREARAAYYGLISQVDYNIGRVFAALQDEGLFDETLIIYTTDHGEFLGDFRTCSKGFFYEPSSHIPFVIRYPRSWNRGETGTSVETAVSLADIMPTIVSAAGGECDSVDGTDLTPLAFGEKTGERRFVEAAAQFGEISYYALTDGTWKYIYYPEGGVEQLFNRLDDPREEDNLIDNSQYSELADEMRSELILRHRERDSEALENDGWKVLPVSERGERFYRNNSWPGYHTEHYGVDVRH